VDSQVVSPSVASSIEVPATWATSRWPPSSPGALGKWYVRQEPAYRRTAGWRAYCGRSGSVGSGRDDLPTPEPDRSSGTVSVMRLARGTAGLVAVLVGPLMTGPLFSVESAAATNRGVCVEMLIAQGVKVQRTAHGALETFIHRGVAGLALAQSGWTRSSPSSLRNGNASVTVFHGPGRGWFVTGACSAS